MPRCCPPDSPVTVVHVTDADPAAISTNPEATGAAGRGRIERRLSDGWAPYIDHADTLAVVEANPGPQLAVGFQPDAYRLRSAPPEGRFHDAARHGDASQLTCRRCGRAARTNWYRSASPRPVSRCAKSRTRPRADGATPRTSDQHDGFGKS
jgi:hypothetical protein